MDRHDRHDQHDRHERQLTAFLVGGLDQAAAREFDEHLLACERCWNAARADRLARDVTVRLRDAAPVQLADRVRLAVELAAGDRERMPGRRIVRRPFIRGNAYIAAVGGGLVAAIVLVLFALLPSGSPTAPPPIAVVVQYARVLPSASLAPGSLAVGAPSPSPVLQPLSLSVDGAHVAVRYYRLGSAEIAVATSDRAFPEPDGARPQSSDAAMAWSASVSGVSLYCPSSRVLLAAPIPISQLVQLADRLPAG